MQGTRVGHNARRAVELVSKNLDFPSAAHVVEVGSLRLAAWRGPLRQRAPEL